jgi:hypothetical protein
MDQERGTAAADFEDGNAGDPAARDFMQAGSSDGEPRIENSLGDHHHQR